MNQQELNQLIAQRDRLVQEQSIEKMTAERDRLIQEQNQFNPSKMESLGATLKTGLKDAYYGKKQLSLSDMGNNPLYGENPGWGKISPETEEHFKSQLNEKAMKNRKEYEAHSDKNFWTSLLGSVLGQTAGSPEQFLTGGVGTKAAAKGASYGSKIAQGAKNYAKQGALGGAIGGYEQYVAPGENRALNTAVSGAVGGILGAPIGAGVQALKPSNVVPAVKSMFRGSLPKEEILARQEAAKGTDTGLGQILNNPYLTQIHETLLKYLPFSGYQKGVNKTAKELEKRADENLTALAGGERPTGKNVRKEIAENFKETHFKDKEEQQIFYDKVEEIGDEFGIKVNRNNIAETSQIILKEIEENPSLKRYISKKMISDLKYHAMKNKENPGIASSFSGQPEKIQSSIKAANIEKKILRDEADLAFSGGKQKDTERYDELSKALKRDTDEAIIKSGSPELLEANALSNKNFAEKIGPWNASPEARKHLGDRFLSEYESIVKDFDTGNAKADEVEQLKLLTRKLDEKHKQYLRFWKFADQNNEGSVKGMAQEWEKLGNMKKEELIPDPNMRKAMDNLQLAYRMNPKAFNQTFNPENGGQFKIIEAIKNSIPLATTILGSLLTFSNPLAGAGAAATVYGGRKFTKILTDEKLRDKFIMSLLDESTPQTNQKIENALSKALTAYHTGNRNIAQRIGSKKEEK